MHINLFAWGHYSDGCGSKKKCGVNFIICMEVKFRGKNINEFVHIVMLSRYRKWKCY